MPVAQLEELIHEQGDKWVDDIFIIGSVGDLFSGCGQRVIASRHAIDWSLSHLVLLALGLLAIFLLLLCAWQLPQWTTTVYRTVLGFPRLFRVPRPFLFDTARGDLLLEMFGGDSGAGPVERKFVDFLGGDVLFQYVEVFIELGEPMKGSASSQISSVMSNSG
ncbi:hypothetical protein SI65_03280 [Aspergillus cristatus]|uniref:Uncharacterized protein n=1 Tax=Aspergillus cristatus TaxID=573508 RepID=A0A1E3BH32_ASPCR|nr:hypothetical protein SI65_03280 [Aspergillus cristatus]